MRTRSWWLVGVLVFLALPLSAQPFGAWLVKGSSPGYVEVPNSLDFNFTTGFTLEAWVSGSDSGGCSSIAGKNYTQAWWVGVCGTTFRSYIKGTSSLFDGGKVPTQFAHIAVTYDGTTRKHYIDGELVASKAETGSMTTSTSPLRLNSDAAYNLSYANALDEVRIWNVARTQDQIRSTINTTIDAAQPGLVAVYHLDGNAVDAVGGHNGSIAGTGAYLTAPVALSCTASSGTQLCLSGSRFTVQTQWLTADGTRGNGTVVPGASADSGLFWFFGSDNWEQLIKIVNACTLDGHRWIFGASTTNVHYVTIVTDVRSGQTKRYFNYFGQNAPAVIDTTTFASCSP